MSSFETATFITTRDERPKPFCSKNRIILLLSLLLIGTSVLAVVFGFLALHYHSKSSRSDEFAVDKGIIGFPVRLPNDGRYVQWTLLHLNDVYEMLPLDEGRKGGLARVAHIRQLLLEENKQTYTVLAGDLVSPSALSQSQVNGTALNGRQMIAAMNALKLDYFTFGNHEFDLDEIELKARMAESNFAWICSNVFQAGSKKPFSTSVRYKLLTISDVRLLIFGLTLDIDRPYIRIINQSSVVSFVQKEFLPSIANISYDVLVAITHLDMATDVQLAESIPQIDLILGGHEHEDYFLLRGSNYTPIYKADANAFSVYILRCAFNLDTKRLRVYSTLARVTPEVRDEETMAQVVNYWYKLGIQGFEAMGFEPNQTVSCLPPSVELDGRFISVRHFPTALSNFSCECMVKSTAASKTIIGLFDSGSIRIDDILRGTITQYDILRTLPYQNNLVALSVPGKVLARVLTHGMSLKGRGMFLSYCGVETLDQGVTWLVNGIDISTSGLKYNVATMNYARENTDLNHTTVTTLHEYNLTQTRSLINYLPTKYPPC